jgi:hypothetical protein
MGCITLLFYCCVRVMQGVYQAVAWQCVDVTTFSGIISPKSSLILSSDVLGLSIGRTPLYLS